MTPLPKRKLSKARQGKRRRDIKISLQNYSQCPKCQQPKRPHAVCPNCGTYNGKQIINIKLPKKKGNS